MFLIIDTTTRRLAAAAVYPDGRVVTRLGDSDLDHSTTLTAALRFLIGDVSDASDGGVRRSGALSLAGVEGIGVCLGPGSFTGTRIGLTSVRALVQFGGVAAWGFTLFHAMALHAGTEDAIVAIHARADQYYQAQMTIRDGVPVMERLPFIGPLSGLPTVAAWERSQGAVEGAIRYEPEDLPAAELAGILRKLGRDMSPSGDGLENPSAGWQGRLVPLYLQEPFAKVKVWNPLQPRLNRDNRKS